MKLPKVFTPHVIAWSVRKGVNQTIRSVEQKSRKRDCSVSKRDAEIGNAITSAAKNRKDLAAGTEVC